MVATDDLQDRFVTAGALLDDRDREIDMGLEYFVLERRQAGVLLQKALRQADLSDILHQARDAERRGRFLAKAQAPRKDHRVHRHVQGMVVGILIRPLETSQPQQCVRISRHAADHVLHAFAQLAKVGIEIAADIVDDLLEHHLGAGKRWHHPHQLLLDRDRFGLTQACAPNHLVGEFIEVFRLTQSSRCGATEEPSQRIQQTLQATRVSRRFRALGGKPASEGIVTVGRAQMGFAPCNRAKLRHRGEFLEVSCPDQAHDLQKIGHARRALRRAGFLIVDDGVAQAATDAGGHVLGLRRAKMLAHRAAPIHIDEAAQGLQLDQNLLVLDQKALHEEWRIQPWTIEFAHEQSGRQIRRGDDLLHLGTSMDTCFMNVSRGGIWKAQVDPLDLFQHRGFGPPIPRFKVLGELGHAGRADDGACHEPASIHEGQRQRRGRNTALPGKRRVGLRCLTHVRFGVADAEILEQIDTPLRIRVGQIFCGQVPKGQRRIGEQGDPLTVTQLCQSELIRPVQQAVRVLHRHHPGQTELAGEPYELGDAPRMLVREPYGPDLALIDEGGERLKLFTDRGGRSFASGVVLPLSEHRLIAGRPVQLVEIDVVGTEAAQARLQRSAQVGGIEGERPAANPAQVARRPRSLGGDKDLFAGLVFQPGADDRFTRTTGRRSCRDRIHLRGVDEIHPPLESQIKLRMRFCRAVLLAEGHGSKAHCRNLEARFSQLAMFHCSTRSRRLASDPFRLPTTFL